MVKLHISKNCTAKYLKIQYKILGGMRNSSVIIRMDTPGPRNSASREKLIYLCHRSQVHHVLNKKNMYNKY